MALFHQHRWDLIDKTVMPSAYEQARANGQTLLKGAFAFFVQKLVMTFQCKDCTEVKQLTQETGPTI